MLDLLNAPAFVLFSSPVSWAELVGAALGVAMVICNILQIHWGWPLAFLSSVLYGFVFVNAGLFAEAGLQVFFAATALWGWWQWLRGRDEAGAALLPRALGRPLAYALMVISALAVPALALFLARFTSSDVPWWDALPTVLSLAATYLLGKKYVANWPLWIIVNLISMGLFAYKGLWLTVGLYALFAVMAAIGWKAWREALRASKAT